MTVRKRCTPASAQAAPWAIPAITGSCTATPTAVAGPIEGSTAARSENKGVYGLSGVFTVSDQPIPNDPPAFSSAASFSVEENQTDARHGDGRGPPTPWTR